MVVTVAIAVSAGVLGALLALWVDPACQDLPSELAFEDGLFWHEVRVAWDNGGLFAQRVAVGRL